VPEKWAELLRDFTSTETQDNFGSFEQHGYYPSAKRICDDYITGRHHLLSDTNTFLGTIQNGNNATAHFESPLFVHKAQTGIGNAGKAQQTAVPLQTEELRRLINSAAQASRVSQHTNNTDPEATIGYDDRAGKAQQTAVPTQTEKLPRLIDSQADRVSRHINDTDFAARLDRYLVDKRFQPTASSHTQSPAQGALAREDSSGLQSGSEIRIRHSQGTVFSPHPPLPLAQPRTHDPLQTQAQDLQETHSDLQLSYKFMAQRARLRLHYEHYASIATAEVAGMASEGVHGMIKIWDNMQLAFDEEVSRMNRENTDDEHEL
jgi:hypothetical protein